MKWSATLSGRQARAARDGVAWHRPCCEELSTGRALVGLLARLARRGKAMVRLISVMGEIWRGVRKDSKRHIDQQPYKALALIILWGAFAFVVWLLPTEQCPDAHGLNRYLC